MKTSRKVIWGLTGKNKGDNVQVEVLCQAFGAQLGAEPVFKNLTCIKRFVAPNIFRGANLNILSATDRDKLKPQWPDIIIGAGRKSVGVARWVKKQSGNRARLVWIGRPKAPLEWFDLVISTPQYGLPDAANVYKLALPLVPQTPMVSMPEKWADLPRPWIGVLVGGANFPLKLDEAGVSQLADCIAGLQKKHGGTCLISTSPRTGNEAGEELRLRAPEGSVIYLWQKAGENPYQAILSNADRFIVTGDSATMMAEACRTGKPVEVFGLERSPLWPRWQATNEILAWLVAKGVLAPPRDVAEIHETLSRLGMAEIYGHKNPDASVCTQQQGQEQSLADIIARVLQ